MSRILPSLFVLLFFTISSAAPPPGYSLVWSDEFDGPSLDTTSWTFDTNSGYEQTNLVYYTNGLNLTFENGAAVLWAKKEHFRNIFNYTSCGFRSWGKREFMFGYIEARIRAPYGRGLWPFFWMMGRDYRIRFWPSCGQIDVYDQITGSQLYNGTPGDECFTSACYFQDSLGGTSIRNRQYNFTQCLCDDYHLYAIDWDSTGIRYYFDGVKYWEFDSVTEFYDYNTFHNPYFFIVGLGIGDNIYGGIDTTIFPQRMYIDYVRVYQKSTQVKANPQKSASKIFTLSNPSQAQLKVYNLQGRLIGDYTDRVRHLKPGENVMKGIESNLPIGIYAIRLFDGVKTVSEKLVIRK